MILGYAKLSNKEDPTEKSPKISAKSQKSDIFQSGILDTQWYPNTAPKRPFLASYIYREVPKTEKNKRTNLRTN